jgi:hypothetical protein
MPLGEAFDYSTATVFEQFGEPCLVRVFTPSCSFGNTISYISIQVNSMYQGSMSVVSQETDDEQGKS